MMEFASWDGWNFPTEWKVMKNSMVPVTTNQKVYEFKVDTVHTDLFRVTHAQMFSPPATGILASWHPGASFLMLDAVSL
jgi:hypothetical protein